MKKYITTSLLAALMALSLTGCDVMDMDDAAKELIPDSVKETIKENTKEAVSQAGDAVKDAAKEVAKEAGQAVKEAAKEVAATAGEAVKEKAKEAAKETAINMAEDAIEEAIKGSSSISSGLLQDTKDIGLTDVDGNGRNYQFTYGGYVFSAEYTKDNWRVIDSYRVDNAADMRIICQALIDLHPVHGKDMVSYRTADDMVYEWQIHNMAYGYLEEGDPRRQKCKDVDFDPEDQNRSVEEFLDIYG